MERRVWFKEHLGQDRFRLVGGDDDVLVARCERNARLSTLVLVAFQACFGSTFPVLDSVFVQQFQQFGYLGRVAFALDHKAFVGAFGSGSVSFEVALKLAYQAGRMLTGHLHCRKCSRVVTGNSATQGDGVADGIVATDACTSASTLLDGHADGPIVHRIGIAIRWIQEVKALFGEVEAAHLVEVLRGIFSKNVLKLMLERCQLLVQRFCSRSHVKGIVDALLVEIQVQLWHPLLVHFEALLRFNLYLPCPVSVQVKEVVVRTPTWPRFVVFHGLDVGLQLGVHLLVVPVGIAISSVRVDRRIEDDHLIFQPGLYFGIVGIGQSVEGRNGRFHPDGFVAMDVERHPVDRNLGAWRSGKNACSLQVVRTDLLESSHVFWTR